MKQLLKGARVVDPARGIDGHLDVLIEDGRIVRVERNLPAAEAREYTMEGVVAAILNASPNG